MSRKMQAIKPDKACPISLISNVESESFSTHEAWHKSTLKSLSSSSPAENDDREMLLYSYSQVVHGFSARLTPQSSSLERFTTQSQVLGLRQNLGLWPNTSFGQVVTIGIIDTGIWPGMPIGWKDECENGTAFTPSLCNKNLIDHDYDLPRDFFGHGTHTPSTAAGNHNAIIAIGSLSAVEKATVFVCAAGNNNGPSDNSTYNGAPWITTVGAGTLDRTFSATFTLDNGFTIEGSYVHEC
ncbi:unnamed protein product [Malus baccata var. baccata]